MSEETATTATKKKSATVKVSTDEVLTLFKECLIAYKGTLIGCSSAPIRTQGDTRSVGDVDINDTACYDRSGVVGELAQIKEELKELKATQVGYLEVIQKLIYNKDLDKIVADVRTQLQAEEEKKDPTIVLKAVDVVKGETTDIEKRILIQGSTFKIRDTIKTVSSAKWNGTDKIWSVLASDVGVLKDAFNNDNIAHRDE